MRATASNGAGSPEIARGAAPPLLKTEQLSVRFGGLAALSQVNFEVARGELRAIIGPNGAGKSTFFNCLTGVLRPTSGRIILGGDDIGGLPSNLISQKGVARSYQITNILPNATVLENVRIAAQSRRHGWNMLSHHTALADINEKAETALGSVGLLGKAHVSHVALGKAVEVGLGEGLAGFLRVQRVHAEVVHFDALHLRPLRSEQRGQAQNRQRCGAPAHGIDLLL